ncbi:hypothetical protein D3C76_1040910 [compost metagenome]
MAGAAKQVMGKVGQGLFEQGALVLHQRCRSCRVVAAGEHAGDAQRHLAQHRVARGDATEADAVARILWVGGVEHFQVQLGAAQVALRAAALERQFGPDLFPAITWLPDDKVVGHEHVIEEHFIEIMLAQHVVDRPNRDAGGTHVDQQLRQPGMTIALVLRSGAQEGDHVVAAVGTGGPDLAAIDEPTAFGFYRPGLHRRQVGADIRLAHANAEQ